MEILRTQPISNDGEKIDKVAIRMPNGEVFTGSNHWDAADTVPRDQWRESRGNFEEGFLTNRGRFLDREEAFNLAKNYIRTPIESPIEGELETLTFRDAVKTQAALDEMDRAIAQLSSQQLNLFDDYAATLPAPAKVSKAALAERVGKEVPKIPDSKQAIDDLMSLAQHERRPPAVGLTHRVLGTVSPQVPAVEVAPAPEVQRELPEGKQVTISARTVDGAEVKIEMDAKKAERLLMKRESAFKALSDCLEAA